MVLYGEKEKYGNKLSALIAVFQDIYNIHQFIHNCG